MFFPFLKRFSEEEVKSLLKYHSLHGSNWQKISELTGRSSYSLEKRFAQISTVLIYQASFQNFQICKFQV